MNDANVCHRFQFALGAATIILIIRFYAGCVCVLSILLAVYSFTCGKVNMGSLTCSYVCASSIPCGKLNMGSLGCSCVCEQHPLWKTERGVFRVQLCVHAASLMEKCTWDL